MRRPDEFESPSCAQIGGDFWFPEKSDGSSNSVEMLMAKSICRSCLHRSECAEWGINKERFGIWGGLTENERRTLRRQKNITLKESDVA